MFTQNKIPVHTRFVDEYALARVSWTPPRTGPDDIDGPLMI